MISAQGSHLIWQLQLPIWQNRTRRCQIGEAARVLRRCGAERGYFYRLYGKLGMEDI